MTFMSEHMTCECLVVMTYNAFHKCHLSHIVTRFASLESVSISAAHKDTM